MPKRAVARAPLNRENLTVQCLEHQHAKNVLSLLHGEQRVKNALWSCMIEIRQGVHVASAGTARVPVGGARFPGIVGHAVALERFFPAVDRKAIAVGILRKRHPTHRKVVHVANGSAMFGAVDPPRRYRTQRRAERHV